VLTFDNLIARTNFVPLIKFLLQTLEQYYARPVDIEFAVQRVGGASGTDIELVLLQCRPLSYHQGGRIVAIPKHVPEKDKLFTATRLVPQGIVSGVRYIVWVDPEQYDHIQNPIIKTQVARTIGQLNRALTGTKFIMMGPGRWGSSNINLGVKVTYADINHASALIEVALAHGEHAPEASYGTHFFQDLVESQIYPIPIYPDDPQTTFNWQFFNQSPNVLPDILPNADEMARYIKVIDVPAVSGGKRLEIIMNSEEEKALGYLRSS
jgi:hypothetical protein